MEQVMVNRALTLAVLLMCLQIASAQEFGSIKGVVLEEAGEPVAGAHIQIAENKAFYGHRILQFYETDSQGRYAIDHIPWGTYIVMAGKVSAGYPDMRLAFYSNLAVPTVTLSPQFPTATMNLKLGPKAGILKLRTVTDASTGKKIDNAAVTLKRVNSEFFIKTSAPATRILVPALTDVSVLVEAPGYEPWKPGEPAGDGIIRLLPQQVMSVSVQLRRSEAGATNEK
jgi:hypothetical protein